MGLGSHRDRHKWRVDQRLAEPASAQLVLLLGVPLGEVQKCSGLVLPLLALDRSRQPILDLRVIIEWEYFRRI